MFAGNCFYRNRPAPSIKFHGIGIPVAGTCAQLIEESAKMCPHMRKHVLALGTGRLTDIALVKTYGQPERPLFGPMYDSHEIKGDKVLVKFKYSYGGMKTCDGKDLNWFEVSDGTKGTRRLNHVKAQARTVGPDTVEVWSPGVKEPKFVRFGWHTLARFNLTNKDGLPAVSFRTDKDPL